MNIENVLLMRNELMLTVIGLIVLGTEIFTRESRKKRISALAIVLFAIHTALGFLPGREGSIFGGMYNSTALTTLMKNILNIGVLIVLIQSVKYLHNEENRSKISEYYLLLISTLIGMSFMISSGDFLMFYLGLETATIPLAALAAYDRYKNKSAEAGAKLILISALSSGILLFGLSMIYGMTGSFYFTEVAPLVKINALQILAFIFFFSGMAFKISIVPFHLWTADVYEGAPVNIASYLSVISKGAAVFIFTIILFKVFAPVAPMWKNVIYVTSILTMTIGNLFALRQKNLKRYLAFSSIAQAGFILLGIIAGTPLGMTTVIYFVLVYIFSNLAAFGIVAVISEVTGKETMSDLDGFYKTNPKLSLLMMLALFSLAGIPPVAGFFGKFFLFTAAAQQGYYILVLIAVLNTIVSLYYYLLPVKAMFINKNEQPIPYFKSDNITRLGLLICALGIAITGFFSYVFEHMLSLSFGL